MAETPYEFQGGTAFDLQGGEEYFLNLATFPALTVYMPLVNNLTLQNGTGTATFTRSSTATFKDKADGLIKVSAMNAPRFELEGTLLEGASTNEALHNRDFTNAVHVKTSITALKDAIGADGVTNSASTLTATGANGTVFQTVTKASAENTFSIDIRRKTGTGIIEITDDGGSNFTDITASLNNSTYTRFQLTRTQVNPEFGLRLVTSGDEVEVDYEQLEALALATSRTETTTIPVPRSADNLSIDAANIPALDDTYTISLLVTPLGIDTTNAVNALVNVEGETDRVMRIETTTDFYEYSHNATSQSTTAAVAGTKAKVVVTVDANQTLFVEGVQEDQDTKGTVTGTKTSISLGKIASGSYFYGHLSDFRIYNGELTPNQVTFSEPFQGNFTIILH